VALVDEPPPEPVPASAFDSDSDDGPRSHDEVAYELDDSPETRAAIEFRLRGDEIAHVYEDDMLVVGAEHEADVDRILEEIALGPPDIEAFADPDPSTDDSVNEMVRPSDFFVQGAQAQGVRDGVAVVSGWLAGRWRRRRKRKDQTWPYDA
jgi:hypothetical protein